MPGSYENDISGMNVPQIQTKIASVQEYNLSCV